MKLENVKTLDDLAEYINSLNEEPDWWNVSKVIEKNRWKDELGEETGICRKGRESLEFNEYGKAVVVEIHK